MNKQKYDIVRDDKLVRTTLLKRISELTATPTEFRKCEAHEEPLSAIQVVADANKRGCNISTESYSRFVKHGNIASSLTQSHIRWLCARYGIPLELKVGVPTIDTSGAKSKVRYALTAYDEKKCLDKIKTIEL